MIRLSAPSPENPPGKRIIPEVETLIELSLACCYASTRDDQFGAMNTIFSSLPTRGEKTESLGSGSLGGLEALHDRVDLLDSQLETCETLARHHCPRTLSAVRDSDAEEQAGLVMSLCRRLADRRRLDPLTPEEGWRGAWIALRGDLMRVTSRCFLLVEPTTVDQYLLEAMLT